MSEQFWVAACNAAVNSDVQLLYRKTRAWGAVVVRMIAQLQCRNDKFSVMGNSLDCNAAYNMFRCFRPFNSLAGHRICLLRCGERLHAEAVAAP
jgi:hypothetical protein